MSRSRFLSFQKYLIPLQTKRYSSPCVSHLVNSSQLVSFQTLPVNTCAYYSSGGPHWNNNNEQNGDSKSFKLIYALFGFATGSGLLLLSYGQHRNVLAKAAKNSKKYPVYSKDEVARHYDEEKRVWVAYKNGVYDVTDFIKIHPGGSRILMAAGGFLEPFWELYPVHQRPDILEMLEKYRIGDLKAEDVMEFQEKTDHFKGEPSRHPCLMAKSKTPFNGETPPSLLVEKFYTPNDVFYVRNHLPVPEIDVKTYEMEIEGLFVKEKVLTLADIKKFPKHDISATIQCGGNRRSEMGNVKPVAGLNWSGGAIGNAKWSGALLRDVLKSAGFKKEDIKDIGKYHIQFEGYDSDQSGECYGASIPLSYILDDTFEALLAYEMNDKPIPLDHGFPVRIILPGIVGARSVKWLRRIVISDEESQAPWQQRDYKVFNPSVTMNTVDFSSAPAITDTPITSYICSHENGQQIQRGVVKLKGYAFSGGGRKIVRVEISKDYGKTWEVTKVFEKDPKNGAKNWSWVLWEHDIDLKSKGEVEIWVKAVDTGYNQQAEDFKNIWNYRGLLSNAYHKLKLKVQ